MNLDKWEDKGLEGKRMEFRFYSVLMGSHQKDFSKEGTWYDFKRTLDMVWRMCSKEGNCFRSPGRRWQGLIMVVVNAKALFCLQLIDNMTVVLLIWKCCLFCLQSKYFSIFAKELKSKGSKLLCVHLYVCEHALTHVCSRVGWDGVGSGSGGCF